MTNESEFSFLPQIMNLHLSAFSFIWFLLNQLIATFELDSSFFLMFENSLSHAKRVVSSAKLQTSESLMVHSKSLR